MKFNPYRLSILFVLVSLIPSILQADPMPDHRGKTFELTFSDLLGGGNLSTIDSSGERNATLLVFWSMHCGPCLAEIPELNALYAEWKPLGLEIIGFPQDESPEELISLCRRFGVRWPQNFESGSSFSKPTPLAWNVTRTPGFLLLDAEGRVVAYGNSQPREMVENFLD